MKKLSSPWTPSGRWVQRVRKSLHKKLHDMAKADNVSLNRLVESLLSESVGDKKEK